MRVLVTWGSKRGGTEGIARVVGEALQEDGFDVSLLPPREAARAAGFDAAIVGGALYANRWHPAARRFVNRQEARLRGVPVWFFSSGPLDDSPERSTIPPTLQVETLMERVGAQGHATFGGRLTRDAPGFPARAMAKRSGGDWRSPTHVRAWASEIARALPTARPGVARTPPGRSLPRLFLHAIAGWALCAAAMGALLAATTETAAIAVHAFAAPLFFLGVARHYFHARGARDPLPTALAFAGTVALLDLVLVAGLLQGSLRMFGSIAGSWLPLVSIFLATWLTGLVYSTLPWPKPPPRAHEPALGARH